MSFVDVVIVALAGFYPAYALTSTTGPLNVFKRIHTRLPMGGLTTCFVCAEFWFCLGFYALFRLGLTDIVYPFAAAGAALVLFRYTGGSRVE